MTTATYTNPPSQPGVVRVRAGRLGLLLVVVFFALAQIPMYTLPALLARAYRRLLEGHRSPGASSR